MVSLDTFHGGVRFRVVGPASSQPHTAGLSVSPAKLCQDMLLLLTTLVGKERKRPRSRRRQRGDAERAIDIIPTVCHESPFLFLFFSIRLIMLSNIRLSSNWTALFIVIAVLSCLFDVAGKLSVIDNDTT